MADKRPTRKQPSRSVKRQKVEDQHKHTHDHQQHHERDTHHEDGNWDVKAWTKYWSSNQSKKDHIDGAHECLLKYKNMLLQGKSKAKVFVPLCGKSYDLKWLSDLGHEVVGLEFSETAVKQFFSDNKIAFTATNVKAVKGKLYQSTNNQIRIYVCDFYLFKPEVEKNFDAIWDTAAMHSQPEDKLQKYADIMKSLMTTDCQYLAEFCFPSCFSKVGKSHLQVLFGKNFKVEDFGLTKTTREVYKNWGMEGFKVYHIIKK